MTDFGDNFKELCRLCASFDAIRMEIFGDKGKERKLVDKIHACLPVKVSEEDLLPKSLCYRCIYNLENFYDFRKGCVDSVSRLESYVNETWGNALELQYKPQKNVVVEKEQDLEDGVNSNYSDSQEGPNPADFLEACMNNEPIHSSSPQYEHLQMSPAYGQQEQVIEVNAGSFVCPSCPQSFSNMSALIIHSKRHMGGGTLTMTGKKEAVRLFNCPVCDKSFVSKGNLSNHIKVHSSEGYPQVHDRPFRCELCNKTYTVAKHLWGHVSTAHRGDPRVTCQHCFRIFSTSQNLEDHCKTKHSSEQLETWVEHSKHKSNETTNAETESGEPGDLNKSFTEEMSNNRRKNSNPRKIEREQNFDAEHSNHSVNEESESPVEETSASCLLCGQMFDNRTELRKHILIGHGIDPAEVGYPDMEMDELSIQREQMDESEMAESMLEAETVFCCEVCIREFNDRASLWLHMLYSHREEAATACGICLRVCSDNVSLLEHVDSCHPRDTMVADKRRYSCQICARQHDSRKKLLAHVKIHNLKDADGRALDPESMVILNSDFYGTEASTLNEGIMDDEFSMSCEVCFKSFPSEIKLIKHKRNAHKDSEAMHSSNSSATYKLFFPCEMCGLSHSTRTERWRHVFNCHADEPSLVCERGSCGKVFPTRALKHEHSANHHQLQGDTPNTCEICGKLWATRMNYWKHMMGVHSDCLPFICGVCLKVFSNVSDLSSHVKDKHYPLDNSVDFCCDICGRPYSKKSKMSRHRKIHNLPSCEGGLEDGVFDLQPDIAEGSDDPRSLKCGECPTEEFLDLEELSEHRRSAHNLVPCDLCPKFYGRTSHLWKHVYKIHRNHPDITCNICFKTSASRDHLAKHHLKHHRSPTSPEENNYVTLNDVSNNPGEVHNCSKCNKVFRKDHLMRQHLKHCTGPKPQNTVSISSPAVNGSFSCEKCSKVFDTQSVLRKHIRSAHIMYNCEICEVSKDSRTELFEHIKTEHTNHPELTCDVSSCQRMLRLKKDLLKHQNEHRQGYHRPTCDFCGELLPNRLKLRKHLRSNHIKKTKYMCSICTITHVSFEELQDHIKEIHPSSVGKPNTCAICARKCPTKYKLETHLKTHGNDFFNCLTCYAVFRKEDEFNEHCLIHPPKKPSIDKTQESVKDSDAEGEIEEGDLKRKISLSSENDAKLMRLKHRCTCCKSGFATTNELFKHQLKEHVSLLCETCNSFLESEDALVTHKNICKPNEGRLKRKSASSSFIKSIEQALRSDSDDEPSPTNMSFHNSLDENSSSSKEMWGSSIKHSTPGRKVYENDNTFSPCELCDKSYPFKRALWQHLIRSHKLEAATACGVCLKLCGSYHDLDMHLVEMHPRNFEEEDSNSTCRVCGRYHNARTKLLSHAVIHVGDENRASTLHYNCSKCNKTFNSRGFLIKHDKEEHRGNNDISDKGGYLTQFPSDMCSDDDDTQFEGFPVESCNLVGPNKEFLKQFQPELLADVDDSNSRNSVLSAKESSVKEEDVMDTSAGAIHDEMPSRNSSDRDCSAVTEEFNKRSPSRDSFEMVENIISQNIDETLHRSSDLDKEKGENVQWGSDVNKEDNESIDHHAEEDMEDENGLTDNVNSMQSESGFIQCTSQSIHLENSNLPLPFTNDNKKCVTQNMSDTDVDSTIT